MGVMMRNASIKALILLITMLMMMYLSAPYVTAEVVHSTILIPQSQLYSMISGERILIPYNLIVNAIRENSLDAVVVAACSPSMHEETFRNAVKRAGLNPYLCEIANIREQCSWVHEHDKDAATVKAIRIIKNIIAKVSKNEPLHPVKVPVNKKCLVIGGGISGIQAALDVANSGYEVILVEKEPSIGGHMAQLSETFPTLDCSQCILTPKMVAVSRHPNIRLLTYSEVIEVSGYVGNFRVKILKKPRYVIEDKCTACGDCEKVCASACFYPFRERVFDVVVFHDSLHHFINPFKALREVSKIVKCNGRVMIFDFDKASLTVKLLALAEKLIGFPASFINLKHLVKYASKRGFRVIEYRRKIYNSKLFKDFIRDFSRKANEQIFGGCGGSGALILELLNKMYQV